MYVPIARITVHKKTDAQTFDAIYTFPLYKLLHRGKCERVSIARIEDPSCNPMMEVLGKPGQDATEAEEERLIRRFGKAIFFMVFPGDTFRETFAKAAKPKNEWLEKHEKEKAAALAKAKAEARTVVVANG